MNKTEPQFAISDRFLDQPYTLAGRLIDPISGMLSWQGKREHLRRKELEVLALLASSDGKQVTRDNFIAVVWQGNDLVGDRGLSNTIVFVRKSLRDDDDAHPVIRTIPRRGYQLGVPVQQPPEAAVAQALVQVEAVFVPGGMIPECPGWRLVRRLSDSGSQPDYDSWLAEPSEFGERDQSLRVFRFCRSEAHLQRLRREVTLLRYLRDALRDNQHFALIQDWQLDEPPYFLARDYTAFGTLSQWRGLADAPVAQRMAMIQGLCDGVAAMHALGVVHRQLSAETILVDSAESGPQLKISAFDLAALNDRSSLAPLKITAAGLTVGVGELGAELTAADDVVALGLALLQLMLDDLQAQPSAECLSGVANPSLQKLLSRCLGPAPARPSAGELAAQLRGLNTPETAPIAAIASTPEAVKTPAAIQKPLTTPLPLGVPTSIGNYHLLDRLGEGGMGTVYLAEQRAPVYRKVALKIIRSGLDGKQILSRFDAERQALAMMNHPNVAAVHESGMAEDGRPFFAMEYIAGDDITCYCDAHHLNLPARIKLFLQVCDGVLHAHQKGVLHRDIKPSNLMVSGAPDNTGTMKVIDFGLAKSLHGKLAAHTLHTSFGAFIGTPIYSSPEHVLGAASGVDTRSDIYSMGVVLYELLAGRTPIAAESLENLEPEKVRELVCKSKLPSMREQLQNTSAEKRAAIAEHRAIKLDELPKTLEGDLSWVVGKCLERDPNDRYASVLELKKDLERWLENRPVEARSPTWGYRLRKMVRRNWGVVILGSAVALALIITTTAAIIGFVQTKQALIEAELAAEFQTKQMEAIDPAKMGLAFRESLLAAVKERDLKQGIGEVAAEMQQKEIKRQLLGLNFTDLSLAQLKTFYTEPALAAIKNDLIESPLLQAKLWTSVASIQSSFGQFEEALKTQDMALALQRHLLDKEALPIIQSLRQRGKILTLLGRVSEGESDLRTATEAAQRQLGPNQIETLRTLNVLVYFLDHTGQSMEALAVLTPLLETCRKTLGNDHPETLEAMRWLTSTYVAIDDLSKAAPLATELVERSRRVFGVSHQRTVTAMLQLSNIFRQSGEFEKAEQLQRELWLQSKTNLGEKHLTTNFVSMHLAFTLVWQGKLDEAEIVCRESLDRVSESLGPSHIRTLLFENNLAEIFVRQRRLREADRNFRRIISIMQKSLSIQSPDLSPDYIVDAIVKRAAILVAQEKFVEALSLLRNTLELHEHVLGAEHEQIMDTKRALAFALMQAGMLKEAQKRFEETLEAHTRVLGAENSVTLQISSEYAWLLKLSNRPKEAETRLRQVLAAQRSVKDDDKLPKFITLGRLVSLLREQGSLDEALSLGQEMLAADDMVRNNSYQFGLLQLNHAHTLAKLGRYREAEEVYLAAYKNLTRWSDEAHELKELAQAMLELYSDWNIAKPNTDLNSKVQQWRERLEQFEKQFGRKTT